MQEKKYKTVIYARLSKEDGDDLVSNSILNQIEICKEYIRRHRDLKLAEIFQDDGYTGMNYQRPGFSAMMKYLSEKKAECVIFKDYSRFGREAVGLKVYLERELPLMGIRFISVTEDDDSLNASMIQKFMRSFKSITNEGYSRDISDKINGSLSIKRKRGDFVGARAPFGYMRSSENKNELVIYEPEAEIVRRIFNMFRMGYTPSGIADSLNNDGILSPSDMRMKREENYYTPFAGQGSPAWHYRSVTRILTDQRYTGIMIQGKTHKRRLTDRRPEKLPETEWDIVENKMESIIANDVFEKVQEMLGCDMRAAKGEQKRKLFAGYLYCADCGAPMTRITQGTPGKCYCYYMCSNNKRQGKCSPHRIREDIMAEIVKNIVKYQFGVFMELGRTLEQCTYGKKEEMIRSRYKMEIKQLDHEIESLNTRKMRTYEDYKDGLLGQAEFMDYQNSYKDACDKREKRKRMLFKELESIRETGKLQAELMHQVDKYNGRDEFDEAFLFDFVDRIKIYEDKRIEVWLRAQKYMDGIMKMLQDEGGGENGKKE